MSAHEHHGYHAGHDRRGEQAAGDLLGGGQL